MFIYLILSINYTEKLAGWEVCIYIVWWEGGGISSSSIMKVNPNSQNNLKKEE